RTVRQMKQTRGTYTETEWIKSDSAETDSAPADTKSVEAVKMNSSEWNENVQKVAAIFGNGDPVAAAPNAFGTAQPARLPPQKPPIAQVKTGVLSPLREDEE